MAEKRLNKYRFVIEALMCPSRVTMAILNSSIGALVPLIMADLAISRGTISWFISAPQILTVACGVPASIIASRIGLKKTFVFGSFCEAAGIFAPFCNNFLLLMVIRVLYGLGIAMTGPIAAGIIAQWFSRKEMPLYNGINSAAASTGQTISRLITVPIAMAISWRWTFATYSLLILLTATAWLLLGKEKPRVVISANITGAPATGGGVVTASLTTWQILRKRETLILAICLSGAFGLFFTLSAWLPTYYYEVFKMPLSQASSVSAIFMLGGLPAGLIGGILPSRLGLRRPILIISGLMLGVTGVASFIVNNPYIIFPAVALYGFFAIVYMPSVLTIPMELPGMTPQQGAIILSLAMAAGNLAGFIEPIAVGYLADYTGSYLPGFLVCCVLSLSLFVGGLLLQETGPGAKKVPKREGW
jgi:CP family cyanate transporter-like MFS transporter